MAFSADMFWFFERKVQSEIFQAFLSLVDNLEDSGLQHQGILLPHPD